MNRSIVIALFVLLLAPAASAQTNHAIDRDGDGLFEWMPFPADWDSDGSTSLACRGVADPDPACPFAGPKVWPDAVDDMNAAIDRLAPGGTIEGYGDYIFPIRPLTCSDSPKTSCQTDSDCSPDGTCEANGGYFPLHTYPSGKRRTERSASSQRVPSFHKTGMTYTGTGMDVNGEQDGVITGHMWMDDRGNDDATSGEAIELGVWGMSVGPKRNSGDSYGEGHRDIELGATTALLAYDHGDNRICVCNTAGCGAADWIDSVEPGDWVHFSSGTYTDSGNTAANFPMGRVTDASSETSERECDSGNGIWLGVSVADFDGPATPGDTSIYRVRPEMITSDITIEKFSFRPQNPFQNDGYTHDSAINCGEWDGNVTRETQPEECDTGGGIGIFSGFRHTVRQVAVTDFSNMDTSLLDGEDGCYDCAFDEVYVGRGKLSASVVDTGTGWRITNSLFDGCSEYTMSTATCLRTLGDLVRIEDNTFKDVGRMVCDDFPTQTCASNNDCIGNCSPTANRHVYLNNASNVYVNNIHMGGAVDVAALYINGPDNLVQGNRFWGMSTQAGVFVRIDAGGDNTLIDGNQLGHLEQFANDNNGGHFQIIAGAQNLNITNNMMTFAEPADSPTPWIGAIRVQTNDANVQNYNINGNILQGFVRLVADDVPAGAPGVDAPVGLRENITDGNRVREMGIAAVGGSVTCTAAEEGEVWEVDDGTGAACTGGSVQTRCRCDGSSLVVD